MKQTAVEWFYYGLKKLIKESELTDMKPSEFNIKETQLLQQAKEMEKEQSYSEEEVIKILYQFHYDLINSNFDTKEEWFEQFKKK